MWCTNSFDSDVIARLRSKANSQRKVMLSGRWDFKGVVLLIIGHFKQIHYPEVFRVHLSQRRHIPSWWRETIHKFKHPSKMIGCWDMLPHLLYLPDVGPSNFYLFRDKITEWYNIQILMRPYSTRCLFFCRWRCFYIWGIKILTERWEKDIGEHGKYIVDSLSFFIQISDFENYTTKKKSLVTFPAIQCIGV